MKLLFRILAITIILWNALPASAQQPLNLDFERISTEGPARPWGWSWYWLAPHAEAAMDSTEAYSGNYSFRISGTETGDGTSPHTLGYWIDPWALKGQPIELKGWLKTEALNGQARITLETWGEAGQLGSDTVNINAGPENPIGEHWAPFKLNLTVDPSAYTLSLTVGLAGAGQVWFDAFTLLADGEKMNEVPVAPEFSPTQMAWLAQQAVPLKIVDPTPKGIPPDFSDLSAFRHIAGDAQLIALGESTHGTSEFFRFKHRLLEYAVKEMGVTVFAMEANQLAVEQINRYVLHGEGDARTALKVMFKVWNTEEMLALIEWMRSYNLENPERKVEFVGYDMQDPQLPIDSLLAFLPDFAPEILPQVDSLLSPYRQAWRQQYYPTGPDSVRQSWVDHTEQVWRLVSEQTENWNSRAEQPSEKKRVAWALQNARVIRQAAYSALIQDINSRDSAMAENIGWLLAQRPPGTRMAIWAHDAHISRGECPDPLYDIFQGGSMGAHLVKQHGDNYRAFGLSTYSGAYSATLNFKDHTMVPVAAFPSPRGSLDEALHRIAREKQAPGLVLDLRPAQAQPQEYQWLTAPRPMRFIGYMAADYSYEAKIAVPYQFDGLIFIDETSHSRVLD